MSESRSAAKQPFNDRLIRIDVVDAVGSPIPGATVRFYVNGVFTGEQETAASGRATLQVSDRSAKIEVDAIYQKESTDKVALADDYWKFTLAEVHIGHNEDQSAALPAGFIQWAMRVVPAQTKFVVGGGVVFAVASLVLGWVSAYSLATTLEIAVIIIIFGALVSALSATGKSAVGSFLTWGLAVIFLGVLILFTSAAFFGVPQAGTLIVSRVLGSYEPLTRLTSSQPAITIPSSTTASIGSLAQEVRDEPTERDPRDIVQDLAHRPPLDIEGRLELSSPSERRILAVSTLRLANGTIVTNGGDLTIETNNLMSDNGSIRAFANPAIPSTDSRGTNGGRVSLIVYGTMSGGLTVDLQGQNGAQGRTGEEGIKGQKGAAGANAASGLVDCQRGAERGGKGGTGEPGSNGGDGYSGGNGGVLIVRTGDIERAKRVIGDAMVDGGSGGPGGPGGKGGPGGDGGDGGSPVGLCSGKGPNGPAGEQGPSGVAGKDGPKGAAGSVRFEPLQASK